MTSAINTDNISGTFPVAGQDNNSQGFRDNFSNIKAGLDVAKSEITTLQQSTAKLDVDNDFNGKILENAEINKFYGSVRQNGPISTNTSVNVENGPLQTYTIGANLTLQFIQWPVSDRYAKIRLHLKSDANVRTVQFVTESGTGNVEFDNTFPLLTGSSTVRALTLAANEEYQVVEAWTFDAGIKVYMRNLGSYTANGTLSGSIGLTDLSNVTIGTAAINQVLKFDSATLTWINGSVPISSASDVTITAPTNNQVLKYNSATNKWINSTDSTTVTDIDNIGNVTIATPTNNQALTYNSSTSQWVNSTITVADINDITNVTINTIQDGDSLKYDTDVSGWVNADYNTLVKYEVTVADNGSGTQEVFFLDGVALKTNTGVVYPLDFVVGNKYRFDLSDASNALAPLKFSTTADTAVPASITSYTTGVTSVGTAGTTGSYIEILITDTTPSSLFLYGDETGTMLDTSLVGGALAISKASNQQYTGSEDLATATAASLLKTASYFSTAAAETATLAAGTEGQVKVFAMVADSGDMVITVSNAGWKTSGTGTITFANVGEACTLQYINNKWYCVGNNAAVFA